MGEGDDRPTWAAARGARRNGRRNTVDKLGGMVAGGMIEVMEILVMEDVANKVEMKWCFYEASKESARVPQMMEFRGEDRRGLGP